MEKETKRFNITMPVATHIKLKITAAQQGITMNEYVLQLINQQLGKEQEEVKTAK